MDNPLEGHPNAVLCIPQSSSKNPSLDKERLRLLEESRKARYKEKAVQTMDDQCLDKSSDNFFEYTSSLASSNDTEPMDVRESERYIASSDEERLRIIKKQEVLERAAKKGRLRRKLKAGKEAQAKAREDWRILRDVQLADFKRGPVFETEALRVQRCRAAEDQARDLSGVGGADGHKWSDNDQRVLELQRFNEDYIKLGVELFTWQHWHFEGEKTLHYRANQVSKVLKTFDRQWKEAYQRIGDNAVKLKQQTLHLAEHDNRGLDADKEPKAADEIVRPNKRVKTKRPPPTKKPRAHTNKAAKPARKPAKLQQKTPSPQKLRRSERLLARKAGRKD